MKQSTEIGKLAAALVKAQAKLGPLERSATNRFNKRYASLDTILETVRPVLAEVGLVVVQGATLPTTDEAGRLSSINLETMLVHESGEWLTNTVFFPVGKTVFKDGDRPPEPTGADAAAAISYGRRYGVMSLLTLSADEEDDKPQPAAARPARRQEKPATAPQPVHAAAKEPAEKKAADKRVATPNGDRRLGDFSEEELVRMQERARTLGKTDLVDAITEVLEEKRNDLPL